MCDDNTALAAAGDSGRARVIGLLAGHLLAAPGFHRPGADGATVAAVVAAEYSAASAAGWVPRPAELAARHPDLADALSSYFLRASGDGVAG